MQVDRYTINVTTVRKDSLGFRPMDEFICPQTYSRYPVEKQAVLLLLPVRYHIFLVCFAYAWVNIASVGLDDHMPHVVDAFSTAGSVIFAVAVCHR